MDLLFITACLTFAVCYSLESVNDLRLFVTPEHDFKGTIDMIYALSHYRNGESIFSVAI